MREKHYQCQHCSQDFEDGKVRREVFDNPEFRKLLRKDSSSKKYDLARLLGE